MGDEQSPQPLIEWGLSHLDRVRQASTNERDLQIKQIGLLIPAVTTIVAGITLFATIWFQQSSLAEQKYLKEYEVSFVPKQHLYQEALSEVWITFLAAGQSDTAQVKTNTTALEQSYYGLEPFIPEERRDHLLAMLQEFEDRMISIAERPKLQPNPKQKDIDIGYFITWRRDFKTQLFQALFADRGRQKSVL
jgi:hypothetical protein